MYKFQKQKQKDQDEFICQLLSGKLNFSMIQKLNFKNFYKGILQESNYVSVESTVDEVIKQLLKINASHSERHVRSLASSLLDELPTKEPLHCQQILGICLSHFFIKISNGR